MKKALITTIGSLFIASLAVATTGPTGGTHSTEQKLSFDDLKTACQNPAAYHNQIAPTNIQISCVDVQTKWVAEPTASMPQTNTRMVTASVTSDKYSVDAVCDEVAMPAQAIGCDRYKEVSERIETVRGVTCDDIIAFKGESKDFCMQAADTMRASNPTSIQTTDTGRTLDLCNPNENSEGNATRPSGT